MTGIFRRSYRSLVNEGLMPSLRKAVRWIGEFCRVSCAALTIRPELRGLSKDHLIDFVFTKSGGVIRPLQLRSEISRFMDIIRDKSPETVIEIGTASGGTLTLIASEASPEASIISVDLPYGMFGGGYPSWRAPLYKACVKPGQRLRLIRKSSHDECTLELVKKMLDDKPVDFLFIDGDHTYEGVKKDFQMYSRLVPKGGMIAMHDIAKHPKETLCDVYRFWEEIKRSYRNLEIIEDKAQTGFGIGILYVD